MSAFLSRRTALQAILLAGASLATGAPGIARPFDQVVESGVLRIALYRDNAPFSDEVDGKPVGIEVDLAKKIAEKLGVKPDIRIVKAAENVDGDFRLNLWKGDLAGSQLADLLLSVPSDKLLQLRNDQVFFTVPYVQQQLSIAYVKGSVEGGFQDLQDIQGRKVAVEGTSPVDALIGFANGGIYRDSAVHYRDFQQAAEGFLNKEADFLAGSRAAIEAALKNAKRDDIEIKDLAGTGLVRPTWELCGAVRSDSRDLGYRIGEAITDLSKSGQMKTLFAAYGVSFTAPAGY